MAEISHEIKQPLATIADFSSAAGLVLKELKFTKDHRVQLTSGVSKISKQTHRIHTIIQRLGRFSRPHGERSNVAFENFVREALLVMANQTRDTCTTIEVDCRADLPTVWVDQIQLEQVLVNLIRNSFDAMREIGEPRNISITARLTDNTLRVNFNDTGPGIPPDVARRIFDSFVTSKATGVGIGLAISRSIIEGHGGSISAISDAAGGRILFTLPLNAESKDEQ